MPQGAPSGGEVHHERSPSQPVDGRRVRPVPPADARRKADALLAGRGRVEEREKVERCFEAGQFEATEPRERRREMTIGDGHSDPPTRWDARSCDDQWDADELRVEPLTVRGVAVLEQLFPVVAGEDHDGPVVEL